MIGNSRQGGSRHWHEIGDAGDIPLPKACEKAAAVRVELTNGNDPKGAKTFGELFEAWLEGHGKKLSTWKDEESRYHMHLAAALGSRPIAKIERKDVREVRDNVAENAGLEGPCAGAPRVSKPAASGVLVAAMENLILN